MGRFHHNGALNPFFEQLASVGIGPVDVPAGVVGVGRAAAGAVEPGPAVPAVGVGHHVTSVEFLSQLGVGDPLPYIPHGVGGVVDKLVAGEELPPGGHRQILRARAAARHALVQAGPPLQVQHVVVEGDGPALPLPF